MMAVKSLMPRSTSLASTAALTRLISKVVVSLSGAIHIAQMRFSTYLALSSSGATLRASNSRSRFMVPGTRGRLLGGSRNWRGDCAQAGAGRRAGRTKAGKTNAAAKIAGRKVAPIRVLMGLNVTPHRSAARSNLLKNRKIQPSVAAGPHSALAGLEPALGLIDHINAAPAPRQLVVAVATSQ